MSYSTVPGFIVGIDDAGRLFILDRPDCESLELGWVDEAVDMFDKDGFDTLKPGVYSASFECEQTTSWEGDLDVDENFTDFKPLWQLPDPKPTEGE
jgi:hypothetical protein